MAANRCGKASYNNNGSTFWAKCVRHKSRQLSEIHDSRVSLNKSSEIHHRSRPPRRRNLPPASRKCETQRARRTQRTGSPSALCVLSALCVFTLYVLAFELSPCGYRAFRVNIALWFWMPTFLMHTHTCQSQEPSDTFWLRLYSPSASRHASPDPHNGDGTHHSLFA